MKLQWFRASLNMAHAGAGQDAGDETVFIEAPNCLAAMNIAGRFPGAKKSRRGTCGNSLVPVKVVPDGARRWYWRGP